MPEENGTGRLDRIERVLERIALDHEQFRYDMKQHLIAQVLQADEIDKLWKTVKEQTRQIELLRDNDDRLNQRVDKLVSAIGEFIRSRPNAAQ
jgi:hypothetical protein